MIMIVKFIFNFCDFSVIIYFFNQLLTLGILFSTVVNAVFVTKLPTLEILPVFLTRPIASEILFFNSNWSVSYLAFKTNALVPILFTVATILS